MNYNNNILYYHLVYHTKKEKNLYIFIGNDDVDIKLLKQNPVYNFFDYSQFKKINIHFIKEYIYYEDTYNIIKSKILTYIPNINIRYLDELYIWKSDIVYINYIYYILSHIFKASITIKLKDFITQFKYIFHSIDNFILEKIFDFKFSTNEYDKKIITYDNAIKLTINLIQTHFDKYTNQQFSLSSSKEINTLSDSYISQNNSSTTTGGGKEQQKKQTISNNNSNSANNNANSSNNNSKSSNNSNNNTNTSNISNITVKSINSNNTSSNNTSSNKTSNNIEDYSIISENKKQKIFINSQGTNVLTDIEFNSSIFNNNTTQYDEEDILYNIELFKNISSTYNCIYNDNFDFKHYINKKLYIYDFNPFNKDVELDNNFITHNFEENIFNKKIEKFNLQIENTIIINFTTIYDILDNLSISLRKEKNKNKIYYGVIKKYLPNIAKKQFDSNFDIYFYYKKISNIAIKNTYYHYLQIHNTYSHLNFNNILNDYISNSDLINLNIKYLYFTVLPIIKNNISLESIFNNIETNNEIIAVKLYKSLGNHLYKINKGNLHLYTKNNNINYFKDILFKKEIIKASRFKKEKKNKEYDNYMIFYINMQDNHNTIIYFILYDNGRYDIRYNLNKTSNISLKQIFNSFSIINKAIITIEQILFNYYSFYKLTPNILFKKYDFITNMNISANTKFHYFDNSIQILPHWLINYAKPMLQYISKQSTISTDNETNIYNFKYKNYDLYDEIKAINETYAKYQKKHGKITNFSDKLKKYINELFNIDYKILEKHSIVRLDNDNKIVYYSPHNMPNNILLFIHNNSFLRIQYNNINKFNNIFIINKFILLISNLINLQYNQELSKILKNNISLLYTQYDYNIFLRYINTNTLYNIDESNQIKNLPIYKYDDKIELINNVELNNNNNNNNNLQNNNKSYHNNSNNTNTNNSMVLNTNNNNNLNLLNNFNNTNADIHNNDDINNDKKNTFNNSSIINDKQNNNNDTQNNNDEQNAIKYIDLDTIEYIFDDTLFDTLYIEKFLSSNKNFNKPTKKEKFIPQKHQKELFDKNGKVKKCKDAYKNIKKYMIYSQYKEFDKSFFNKDINFSKKCSSIDCRKPVIITDKERRYINKHHPGSYTDFIKTGSTDKTIKKYTYFCPNLWCPISRVSITRSEFEKNKSCPVIPGIKKSGEQPVDFQLPPYYADVSKDGKKITNRYNRYPAFVQGSKIPCCRKKRYIPLKEDELFFKTNKEGKIIKINKQKINNAKTTNTNNDEDIKSKNYMHTKTSMIDLIPNTYGALHTSITEFLNYHQSENYILSRYGIIQDNNKVISALLYLLNNPKITTLSEFFKAVKLNMSPYDYMLLNEGNSLKKFHNPLEVPDFTDLDNTNNLQKILIYIKNFSQWNSIHPIYLEKFNLVKFHEKMVKLTTIEKYKTFYKNASTDTIDQLKLNALYYNSFKNFLKYLNDDTIFKDLDDIYDLFTTKFSSWLNIHKYNIIIFNSLSLNKKNMNHYSSFIYIPKYSSILNINHISNFICITNINNNYTPIVIRKIEKKTFKQVYKVFYYHNTQNFMSKFNNIISIYKNVNVSNNIKYFNQAYKIFLYLSASQQMKVKKFVLNYNFKLTGFITINDIFIPLMNDTFLIPPNYIHESIYKEITYVYKDEIFKLKPKLTKDLVTIFINIMLNIENLTGNTAYNNYKIIYNYDLDKYTHLYKKDSNISYIHEFFTDISINKRPKYQYDDNGKKLPTTDIRNMMIKDYKQISLLYFSKDIYIPINIKSNILQYFNNINKNLLLTYNKSFLSHFNNVQYLFIYNQILYKILIAIINKVKYDKELFYIKHPINPYSYNKKKELIKEIINNVIYNNPALYKNIILLISQNIINVKKKTINQYYENIINIISTDILLKDMNYLLNYLSNNLKIADDDIFITYQDYLNNTFDKKINEIKNLYKFYYTSSDDNTIYIDKDLYFKQNNHGNWYSVDKLYLYLLSNKDPDTLTKSEITKFNKLGLDSTNELYEIKKVKNLMKYFYYVDFNNNIGLLFDVLYILLNNEKLTKRKEFLNYYSIHYIAHKLQNMNNDEKKEYIQYIVDNDEIFYNNVKTNKLNINAIAKKNYEEIMEFIEKYSSYIQYDKYDFEMSSYYIIELLSALLKINTIVFDKSDNPFIGTQLKFYNNKSYNFLLLYYKNKQFYLISNKSKYLNKSILFNFKYLEDFEYNTYSQLLNIIYKEMG